MSDEQKDLFPGTVFSGNPHEGTIFDNDPHKNTVWARHPFAGTTLEDPASLPLFEWVKQEKIKGRYTRQTVEEREKKLGGQTRLFLAILITIGAFYVLLQADAAVAGTVDYSLSGPNWQLLFGLTFVVFIFIGLGRGLIGLFKSIAAATMTTIVAGVLIFSACLSIFI